MGKNPTGLLRSIRANGTLKSDEPDFEQYGASAGSAENLDDACIGVDAQPIAGLDALRR
jgi:hypothetical protein